MKQNTYVIKPKDIIRKKYLVNAEAEILGRLASKVAQVLWGKNKPIFSPHMDCGDYVTVYNAEKVKVTGGKEKKKMYFSHSGYPRGDKLLTLEEVRRRDPRRVIYLAVRGMLPRNSLGEAVLKKLKIVVGGVKEEGETLKIGRSD